MDKEKTLQRIARIGSVIMTTIASFVVYPPVLSPNDNDGVNWKNLFVFFAGACSIFGYDKFKNRLVNFRYFAYTLMIVLFFSLISYQFFYNNNSINCFENLRVVICDATMKPSAQIDYAAWKTKYPNPLQELIQAYQCSSSSVWEFKDLAAPYYIMITLYLIIIITIVLLLVILSDQINTESKIKQSSK